MDQETIQLIADHVNAELERDGYTPIQRQEIWRCVTKIILIMDLHKAPIHNPLFVASIHSLARALDLINSLRKTNGKT